MFAQELILKVGGEKQVVKRTSQKEGIAQTSSLIPGRLQANFFQDLPLIQCLKSQTN